MDHFKEDDTKILWKNFYTSVLEKNPNQFELFHQYFVSKYNKEANFTEEDIQEEIM